MRVLTVVLLLTMVLLLLTLASGDKVSKKLLHYLVLSQFSNPRNKQKVVVLPILLPLPVGFGFLTKKLLQRSSSFHQNHLPFLLPQKNKAEIFIQGTGDCTKGLHNCGISAILM